jgi:hypothetical protein
VALDSGVARRSAEAAPAPVRGRRLALVPAGLALVVAGIAALSRTGSKTPAPEPFAPAPEAPPAGNPTDAGNPNDGGHPQKADAGLTAALQDANETARLWARRAEQGLEEVKDLLALLAKAADITVGKFVERAFDHESGIG